jgi:LAO/AO transport system kinase
MSLLPEVAELALRITRGSTRALARGLTWIEAGGPRAEALVAALHPRTGRAHVIGLTGSPGSGKSTLARALARAARAQGRSVGIVAVDPSSPFSGGAILGDRIRMNDLALDPGVFIRSMATRGALGGLCRAAADAVDLMDAAGRPLILVETVGVGQDEVDIMLVAHSVVVVSVPGLGDDIQALKAGILEIADVHAVNKADREGADRTVAELRSMLTLMAPREANGWEIPVLPCVASREEGTEALLDTLDAHWKALEASGELERRRQRIARARVLQIAQELLAAAVARPGEPDAGPLLAQVVRRELAPHACARALLAGMSRAVG